MAVSACKNIAVIFDCTCCSDPKSAELAKGENNLQSNHSVIIMTSTEIAGAEETGNIIYYNVDNKYYSAVINLCWDNDVSAEEADAILVIIDINQVGNNYYMHIGRLYVYNYNI